MKKRILHCCLLLLLGGPLPAQDRASRVVTEDVLHFWEAMDSLAVNTDTIATFQRLVIDRASDDFKIFIRKWKITARNYSTQVRKYPNFYRSLRVHTTLLAHSEDSIRQVLQRAAAAYPGAREVEVCVGFGNFSTGGNIYLEKDRNIIYIGLEYHGLDDRTEQGELSVSTRDYASRSNFLRTIIHEWVHVQQRTSGRRVAASFDGDLLIHRVMSEGSADYISRLIVPGGYDGNHWTFGLKHEDDLKRELLPMLHDKGSGSWFGGDDSLFLDRPRDLGYFMGAMITQHFYQTHHIGEKGLRKLIEVRDIDAFVADSGYFAKSN